MRTGRTLRILLGFSSLSMPGIAADTCALHVANLEADAERLTLVVTHDPRCPLHLTREGNRLILSPRNPIPAQAPRKSKPSRKHTKKTNTIPNNTLTNRIISLAKTKIGSRYAYGKAGPDRFDCSGFVYYAFQKNGLSIPRTSIEQSRFRPRLNRRELRRGDLLFFDTGGRGHVNHSGIYLGHGRFIHASSGKVYGVTISNLDRGFYRDKFRWGGRVILPSTQKKHFKSSEAGVY